MNETAEIVVKAALGAIAAAVVLWRHLRPGTLPARRAGTALALLAGIAALAWTNFGAFHGGGRLAHRWEQFHYFLGAKYFPEVGYDGLYVASMGAQLQIPGGRDLVQPTMRDLRTNLVVPMDQLGAHGLEVRRRFSDARWAEFQRDDADFLNAGDYEYLRLIRLDHGYNPSPLWTFVARLFAAHAPANDDTMTWLATLDLLLLAALFVALGRTYGTRLVALCLLVFGLGYAWRWDWVGGSFLRQDWLVAVGLAVCAMSRRRFATAGALLAYAGLVRVFPFALLLGPAVLLVRTWRRDEDLRWARRFAFGFAVAMLLGLGAGCLAGRGAGAWSEFAANLRKHERTWLTNNVGAKLTLLYGPDTFSRKLVDGSLPDAFTPWDEAMARAQEARLPAIAALAAALLALTVLAAWRAPLDQSIVLGCVAVFALSTPTSYYWAMLAFVPLCGGFRRSGRAAACLLALSTLLFAAHAATNIFERIYGGMSWALLLLAIAWLLPDALGTLRREPLPEEVAVSARAEPQKAVARNKRR